MSDATAGRAASDAAAPRPGAAAGPARFSAYGLVFDSEIPVPSVAPAPAGASADVTVRRGPVRLDAEAARRPGRWSVISPRKVQAEWEGVRVRVEDGARVTMDFDPDRAEDATAAGLAVLYAAACLLLHQRAALPLHASAVAGPEGAALLIGPGGAGKSTFAAMLCAQGLALAGDDMVALDLPAQGRPAVHAGMRNAKLFEDSRAALDRAGPGARALADPGTGFSKSLVEFAPADRVWPAPLRAVFALEWLHPPDSPPERERLGGAEALMRLREAVAWPELAAAMGLEARYFAMLGRLAATTPVFALRRPRRYEATEAAAALVRETLAAEAGAAAGLEGESEP